MTKVVEEIAVGEYEHSLAGKYLTFLLGGEEYAVEILKVQEIIQMQKVTRVPSAPRFIRGVINLRGKIIPVVELRKKFLMEATADTEQTVIIVMHIEREDGTNVVMGIIIDHIREVMDVTADTIEKVPSMGTTVDSGFIMGICKAKGGVKMLLNIDKILTESEIDALSATAQ